jgi:mannose-1-phosphate guanylyltransferase
MICAVILTGGKRTRYWPLSGKNCPKSMLNIVGEKTLLRQTIKGLNRFNNPSHLKPLGNDVNRICFIIEPTYKHTAPAVLLPAITPDKLQWAIERKIIIKGVFHYPK